MKKSILMLLGAGTFIFASCNKTEKADTTETVTTTETTTSETPDYDTMYRERASQTAAQMSKDLKFDTDTAMQRKVSTVYYTRAKRRHDARGKYATDTTGMYMEMRQIDLESDTEFKKILPPQQYQTYEANRTTYYGGFEETLNSPESNSLESASGTTIDNSTEGTSNAKVKTKTEKDGDTKTEIEDENSETKIKTDKDGHTKVKVKDKSN
jgi:hypothetical protein